MTLAEEFYKCLLLFISKTVTIKSAFPDRTPKHQHIPYINNWTKEEHSLALSLHNNTTMQN